jgi:hypothetical protein
VEGAVVVPHVLGMTRRIPMILFNSSSIVAGGYDARSGTLRLRNIALHRSLTLWTSSKMIGVIGEITCLVR